MPCALRDWRNSSVAVDLGIPEPLDCLCCGRLRTVRLWLLYEHYGIAGFFGVVGRRCYSLGCSACGARRYISKWEAQIRQTRQAYLPFRQRYGLPLLTGLLLLFAAICFMVF
jgi:hypothetical protein